MDTLIKIENKLKVLKPLRMRGVLKKRKETLEEFLIKFFNEFNNTKQTIYVESEHLQTDIGKRRSIGDIFRICQYYYPECTVQEVKNILYNELPNKVDNYRSSFCSTINKRVFYKGTEDQESEFFDTEDADEYGLTVDDWDEL